MIKVGLACLFPWQLPNLGAEKPSSSWQSNINITFFLRNSKVNLKMIKLQNYKIKRL